MALTKQDALEYLTRQAGPVTAKDLGIDLDSRASTASELLERMTAQGLVERDAKQRPRQYSLTDAGRKRLEFFQAQNSRQDARSAAGNPDGENPAARAPVPAAESFLPLSQKMEALEGEIGALREDVRDLVSALVREPPPDAQPPGLAARLRPLLQRAEALDGDKPESDKSPEQVLLASFEQARASFDAAQEAGVLDDLFTESERANLQDDFREVIARLAKSDGAGEAVAADKDEDQAQEHAKSTGRSRSWWLR